MTKKNKISSPPAEDMTWRAQSDLRTLADAQAIRADKGRLSAAKAEATKIQKAVAPKPRKK